MYFVGIDIGALTVKAVVLDGSNAMVASDLARSRHDSRQVAARLVEGMLAREGIALAEVGYTVSPATGG